MRPATLKKQTSAGGVIFRRTDDIVNIILVSVKNGKVWCLPKGIVDKGETPEITALREVREETGLTGRIIDTLGDISYWYYIKGENEKCRKRVFFYLMEYLNGDTAEHDSEVDEAEWFPLEIALTMVNFKGDKSVIEKAKVKLEKLLSSS